MNSSPFLYISQLLQQLPDGVVACDADGKLSYFNETLRNWHGLPETPIPQEKWSDYYNLFHEDGKTHLKLEEIPLIRAFNGEIIRNVPMVIAVPGKELRYCEASGGPLYDDSGKKVGASVIMHDVTSLVRSRDLLRHSIETSIAGFDIVNHEGKFIYANRSYLKMWGYNSLEEVIRTSPVDHCLDPAIPVKIISTLKEKGEVVIEFKALRKDKTTFDVLMSARLDHDQDGNEIYPTFSMDLTEIKKAIAARDEFLSIASHELLTPLTSLKLQTQFLERHHLNKTPEIKRYLGNTLRFIDRLNRLVEDMLDISRITSGKFTIILSDVDIVEVLTRKLNEFTARFPNENISLKIETHPHLMKADILRLEQVIENLLSNAEKYAKGTEVTVTLKRENDDLVLSVKDQGRGIPLEAQKRIFQRFERIMNKDVTGLGLGLSIVQEIVILHGWKISLNSEPGKGAEFLIHFQGHFVTIV